MVEAEPRVGTPFFKEVAQGIGDVAPARVSA